MEKSDLFNFLANKSRLKNHKFQHRKKDVVDEPLKHWRHTDCRTRVKAGQKQKKNSASQWNKHKMPVLNASVNKGKIQIRLNLPYKNHVQTFPLNGVIQQQFIHQMLNKVRGGNKSCSNTTKRPKEHLVLAYQDRERNTRTGKVKYVVFAQPNQANMQTFFI